MSLQNIEVEVYYQLLVDPYAANYHNPGQLKQYAIYPAKALYVYTDSRADCFIEEVAKRHLNEWKEIRNLFFTPNTVSAIAKACDFCGSPADFIGNAVILCNDCKVF